MSDPRRTARTDRPGLAARAAARRNRGFTLIELILVLAIVAIIAAIAAPRFAASGGRARAQAAARRIAADLRFASTAAKLSSATRTVAFKADSGYYEIPEESNPLTNRPAPYQVMVGNAPYSVALAKLSFAGQDSVLFDGYGLPASPGELIVGTSQSLWLVGLNAEGFTSVSELTPPQAASKGVVPADVKVVQAVGGN